jgi:hypothetical protein
MPPSARTAISRHTASQPVQQALLQGIVTAPVLDWGCGRGADVREMQLRGLEVFGYDPYWQSRLPSRQDFNFGLCTYVLNVLSTKEQVTCLQQFHSFLKPDAVAWVSVRSAQAILKEANKQRWTSQGLGYLTGSGTYQQGFTAEQLQNLLSGFWNSVTTWQQRDTVFGCAHATSI